MVSQFVCLGEGQTPHDPEMQRASKKSPSFEESPMAGCPWRTRENVAPQISKKPDVLAAQAVTNLWVSPPAPVPIDTYRTLTWSYTPISSWLWWEKWPKSLPPPSPPHVGEGGPPVSPWQCLGRWPKSPPLPPPPLVGEGEPTVAPWLWRGSWPTSLPLPPPPHVGEGGPTVAPWLWRGSWPKRAFPCRRQQRDGIDLHNLESRAHHTSVTVTTLSSRSAAVGVAEVGTEWPAAWVNFANGLATLAFSAGQPSVRKSTLRLLRWAPLLTWTAFMDPSRTRRCPWLPTSRSHY